MTDIYEEIQKRIDDEKNDAESYLNLAEKAKDPGESQILRDIAREEEQHRRNLQYILDHRKEVEKNV